MTVAVPAALVAEVIGQVLRRDARVRLRVRGGSMRPALRGGDRVTLVSTGARPLRPGELVALRGGHGLMIHRFIRRLPDGAILTAGDDLDYRDRACAAEDVLGVVEEVERGGQRRIPPAGRVLLWRLEARRAARAVGRRLARWVEKRRLG